MSNPSANPIQQNAQTNNAKYISLIPENGTEFVAGQKIVFNLDPQLGWIKGRDSYLVFDIENNGVHPIKTALNKGGISGIIKQLNIFSQQNGMLLETLDDYNQWTTAEMQYRHDDTTNLTNIEGCPVSIHAKSGLQPDATNVVLYHNYHNTFAEPESNRLSQSGNDQSDMRGAVRFCTPLRCGIFRHWDTETLVPILQMGGLRIEIILAPALEVLDMPFSGNLRADGTLAGHLCQSIDLELSNDNFTNNSNSIYITDVMPFQQLGVYLGQQMTFVWANGGNQSLNTTITAIENDAGNSGKIKLTLADQLTPACTDGSCTMVLNPASITSSNISYKIKGAEFRVLQEMPPNTKMANMDYVFTSYDLFRDSIPQSQVNYNQDITSVASKAVSLFTMYEDTQYDTMSMFPQGHYHQGLTPDETGVNMNSVVYFINNRLYPLRAYNPNRYGDRVINQNELVKAFGTLNIPVKNLGSASNCDLGEYTNRYMHARELARGDSVFNLQNAEPQIRLGFSDVRGVDKYGSQIGNVRMKTFVFSKKILHIDGESGLSLEH
tara:strand:- start:4203 stop:5855 length:1653 start_codon:yes stop_codon:yes gene_type:complete